MDRWITSARQSGIAPLVRLVGLLDDLDAVHTAVALPSSSGVAEGRSTDLKMIKRQMAGRSTATKILYEPRAAPTVDSHSNRRDRIVCLVG